MDCHKIYCERCGKITQFHDKLALEKHQWEFHPKDDFQKLWSDICNKKMDTMSLGYQDDPYY